VRRVTQPLLIGAWARCCARVVVEWVPPATPVQGPCILAATPHHHWLDAFAVQAALAGWWRTVTVTNRDFSEYFAPDAGVPLATRLGVGLAYHLLWPLVFGFVIVPNAGDTRAGLFELGRAIDRGLSPLAFPKGLAPPGEDNPRHEPGIALMAIQTGLPVVPVRIEGNDGLTLRPGRSRPAVTVRVGAALAVSPSAAVADVVEGLEAAFARLSAAARAGG
jgi:long-chain acyl-CoA synthetase